MRYLLRHGIIVCFLAFAPIFLVAQTPNLNGWEHIANNHYLEAKVAFEQRLVTDSLDADALLGMVYLSEVEENFHNYEKYISTIVRHTSNPYLVMLFQNSYDGSTEDLLNRNILSKSQALPFEYHNSWDDFRNRKFESATSAFSEMISPLAWSMIGPFKNTSGSGHITDYAVEKRAFSRQALFDLGTGKQASWVCPPKRRLSGKIYFTDHLPSASSAVYYANAFFELPAAQNVQIRISRTDPIKVFVDDFLVYEDNENLNFFWDGEIIELDMEAGWHRLLIKSSDYDPIDDHYSLLSFEDNRYGGREGTMAVRLTDVNGALIPVNTQPEANYSSGWYESKIEKRPLSNYFKDRREKDNSLANQYLLAKAILQEGYYLEGEEIFVKELRKTPEQTFSKHMAAKLYAKNGKIERAYEALEGIDEQRSPFFELLWEDFEELDMQNEETQWLKSLARLAEINETHRQVVKSYLKYYDRHGEEQKRERYIKSMLKKAPYYESWMERELEKSNKPTEALRAKKEKQRLKEAKKNMKERFRTYDYSQLIRHYKNEQKHQKVLSLYDELSRWEPFEIEHLEDKANYLYSLERYSEALQVLDQAIELGPYFPGLHESKGDIYYDTKEKDRALENYEIARKYSKSSYLSGLIRKIEKIRGQQKLKNLCETKSFEEVLEEKEQWEDKYKEEDAIVLLFTRDFIKAPNNRVEIHQKALIKVQSEDGVIHYADYDFGFLGNLSHAKVVKANGTVVRPDVRRGYVVCKNLEPGDLIEVEGYSLKYNYQGEIDDELFNLHYLTFDHPVHYAKVEFVLPKEDTLTYLGHKLEATPKVFINDKYKHHRWEFSDLPPLVEEEAIIDGLDQYAYIMTSTMPDWSKVVRWYSDMTYRRKEANYEIREILDSIITPGMGDEEKIATIYQYITREIAYSYMSFLQSNFVPKRPGLTCSAAIGDCKDVATLMITMLQEEGIEAYYVLVKSNSSDHGDMLPSIYFDHVIVGYILNDEMHFTDLTTDYFPRSVLPGMDQGAVALIIRDGETEVFRLPNDKIDPAKNLTDIHIQAKLNLDRSVHLDVAVTYNGNEAGERREMFARMKEEEIRNLIIEEAGNGIFDHLELHQYTFENRQEIDKPLKGNFQLKGLAYADKLMDYLVFRPPYMTTVQYNSVFSNEIRYNGLDLEDVTNIGPVKQVVELEFPEGYQRVELPENIEIVSDFGTYRVTYERSPQGMTITKYQDFKQQFVTPENFEALKAYYFQLLEADASLIAIRK